MYRPWAEESCSCGYNRSIGSKWKPARPFEAQACSGYTVMFAPSIDQSKLHSQAQSQGVGRAFCPCWNNGKGAIVGKGEELWSLIYHLKSGCWWGQGVDVGDRDHQGDICKSGETHTKGGPWCLRGKMWSDRTGSGRNNSVPSHGSQGTESPLHFALSITTWAGMRME